MGIAKLVAKRSPDCHTQVGCCLVKDGCVIGIGYNGAPRQYEDEIDWSSSSKYDYVIHAELNALANACCMGVSCKDAEMYLTLTPCHDCIKMIAQYQIKRVYYKDIYRDFELTKKIANECGIELIQIKED